MSKLPALYRSSKALEQLSPLQLYLREVGKYPLLSPEEEYALAVKHHEGGDVTAAHRLVTANLRLVVKIANDFHQAQINLLDLIQEGNAGLMQAVKKFDPYKGVKLSSYSAWWIRAYILKYIMENKSHVKIGTTSAQRKLFFRLRKEAEKLLAEYDHVDTKLLAANLDVKESEVIEMQKRLNSPDVSFDAPISGSEEGDGLTHGSILADDDASVEDTLATAEIADHFKDHLAEFKKTLKGRDLEVFEMRMLSEEPITLQEIGDKYGITRERARQIETQIVKKLKAFVEEKGIIDVEAN